MATAYYHSPELPWSPSQAEQRRFRLIITTALLAYILLSALVALMKVPPLDRFEAENLPPRLAKLVIQEKPKPPPPPPPEEKKPLPEPVKEAEPTKPSPKPEKKEETPVPDVQAAREKAAHSGLLALSNELASLQNQDLSDLVGNHPLTKAGDNNMQNITRRSIITSQATKGSGGINTAQLSRNGFQTQLAGRSTTTVESATLNAEQQATTKANGQSGRSTEQIQLTLDRSKSALYTLYHRALRANPALQGKVVLEITIAPSGEVSDCKVVSAELNDDDLIHKLVARIRLLNFGAKDVDTTVFTWPIDFLPSS